MSNGSGSKAAAQAAITQATAPVDLAEAVRVYNLAADETKDVVVESDDYVDSLKLATASRTHLYASGSGGVGKTFGVEEWSRHLGVTIFITQFYAGMKREELFGPLSMTELQRDVYKHVTTGMLPTAHFAILDEFKDGLRFGRQLLSALNERRFFNGGQAESIPLLSGIGTTNFWCEEPELEALFDRFAQRIVQEPVKTSTGFKKILKGQLGRDAGAAPKLTVVSFAQLTAIHEAVDRCRVDDTIVDAVDQLRKAAEAEKLFMSPRRWGEGLKIARAAAVIAGRDHVIEDDLRPYARVLPNHPDDFKTARDLCKAFRDKFTEAVEEARAGLQAVNAQVQPQRDAVASGAAADMSVLTNVSKSMKSLKTKIEDARKANSGRDTTPLDRVTDELVEIEKFLHRAVLGG